MQVILSVDTTLQNDKLEISAFVSRRLSLKDSSPLATEFRLIDCEVRGVELDKVGGEAARQLSCSVPCSVTEKILPVKLDGVKALVLLLLLQVTFWKERQKSRGQMWTS